MKVALVPGHQRARLVFVTSGRVIRLKPDWTVHAEFEPEFSNPKLFFGSRAPGQNTHQGGSDVFLRRSSMNFQIDSASRAGLDPPRAVIHYAPEASGSPCNRETWLRVVKDSRSGASLPLRDLLLQPGAQRFGSECSAIEKDGVYMRPAAQKVGKIPRNGTVRGIGKRPLSQSRLRPCGPVFRSAFGEKTVQHNRFYLRSRDLPRERPTEQARSVSGNGYRKNLTGRIGQAALFQLAATCHEKVPLSN